MPSALELLREGRTEELWQKYCGFIDLSLEQFMSIQKRLLLEQIELLKKCELGNKIMRGVKPRSIEEFRRQIPITTYADYESFLLDKREDVLPVKPLLWQRTSGRSGEYPFKWVPISRRLYQELGDGFLAVLIFSTCEGRGDVIIEEHDKFLYGLAPPPYASGCWARRADEEGIFDFLPPIEEAEMMEFEERIQQGFKLGMSEGIDILAAVTSILVAIGERLEQGGGAKMAFSVLSKPRLLARMLKAVIRSKLERRMLLPRDIWSIKGLVSAGTDVAIYREKIRDMWGKYPFDVYGCAESTIIAMQTWDGGTMTFYPFTNLLEFIPEGECRKWIADPGYYPDVLLLDEVKAGETYGIVATNFLGGAFIRYFIGDVIRIESLSNEKLGIGIPQMVFDSRIDGVINIAGFTRLTEKTLWQAIEDSGLAYKEWMVKSRVGDKQTLHLYIEPKQGADISDGGVARAIHEQLKKLDRDYADLETILGLQPLNITVLPVGTFQEYMEKQRANGADLAHLKPPHINPADDVIDSLVNSVSQELIREVSCGKSL